MLSCEFAQITKKRIRERHNSRFPLNRLKHNRSRFRSNRAFDSRDIIHRNVEEAGDFRFVQLPELRFSRCRHRCESPSMETIFKSNSLEGSSAFFTSPFADQFNSAFIRFAATVCEKDSI